MRHSHAVVLALLAGCAGDDLATSSVEQGAGCLFVCGPNSPILGGVPFWMLNLDMVTPEPSNGLVIKKFETPVGAAMRPMVQGNKFWGVRIADKTQFHQAALKGSKLTIESPTKRFHVTIDDWHKDQKYWEGGDDGTTLESYRMSYVEIDHFGNPTTRPKPLCPIDALTSDGWWHGRETLIFRGDVYDANTGTVVATGPSAGSWFNIGCSGDRIAKLVVTRATQATQGNMPMPIWTQAEHRTAALRMWGAAYCGQTLTQLGIPLDWAVSVDGSSWNTIDPLNSPITLDNVEAIWDQDGAVCLNNARVTLDDNPIVDVTTLPCRVDGAVPECTEDDIDNWPDLGSWITVVP